MDGSTTLTNEAAGGWQRWIARVGLVVTPGWALASVVVVVAARALQEVPWVALPEELLFRGLIQGTLQERVAQPWAILLAALLFGLAHVVTVGMAGLATFFPGILFGVLRGVSGSVWPAVAGHAVANELWRTGLGL